MKRTELIHCAAKALLKAPGLSSADAATHADYSAMTVVDALIAAGALRVDDPQSEEPAPLELRNCLRETFELLQRGDQGSLDVCVESIALAVERTAREAAEAALSKAEGS